MKVIFNPIQFGITSVVMSLCVLPAYTDRWPAMFLTGTFLIGLGIGLIGCRR